eukprot:419083_1
MNQFSNTSNILLNKLTWTVIILFSFTCIIFSLFTIIDQVAQASNVLCSLLSNRVMATIVQFTTGCMHILFIAQLHFIYKKTQFAYNISILKTFAFITVAFTGISCVLLFIFVNLEHYEVELWGTTHNACNTSAPKFLYVTIGIIEIIVTMVILYLFISKLYAVIQFHKLSKNLTHEWTEEYMNKAIKITVLSVIASMCTFIAAVIIGFSDSTWPAFIYMPINCICVMLQTNYYPNGYRILCCVFVWCFNVDVGTTEALK